MAHQNEAIRKQQPVVRGTAQQDSHAVEQETEIDALGHNNSKNVPHRDKGHLGTAQAAGNHYKQNVLDVAKPQCPARDTTCKKCHKKSHYSLSCFSRDISQMTKDDSAS